MNKIYTRCSDRSGSGVYDDLALKKCSTLISSRSIYPSLRDSVSCATSHKAPFPRIVIIHLLHHRLEIDKTPGGAFVLFLSCGCANLPDVASYYWSANDTLKIAHRIYCFVLSSELQLTPELPVGVGISRPDGCTLCIASGPTLENAQQFLGWWRHCLPAHRIFPSPVTYIL
ncbi:hypothetical protein T06_8266 [Trichinella sp. T6]|nr:hypothetical protein T06_2755 [Trichinella sp. T6]KRX72689.1 hypothetical protein T06_8266 [Trichinella sp. T6]